MTGGKEDEANPSTPSKAVPPSKGKRDYKQFVAKVMSGGLYSLFLWVRGNAQEDEIYNKKDPRRVLQNKYTERTKRLFLILGGVVAVLEVLMVGFSSSMVYVCPRKCLDVRHTQQGLANLFLAEDGSGIIGCNDVVADPSYVNFMSEQQIQALYGWATTKRECDEINQVVRETKYLDRMCTTEPERKVSVEIPFGSCISSGDKDLPFIKILGCGTAGWLEGYPKTVEYAYHQNSDCTDEYSYDEYGGWFIWTTGCDPVDMPQGVDGCRDMYPGNTCASSDERCDTDKQYRHGCQFSCLVCIDTHPPSPPAAPPPCYDFSLDFLDGLSCAERAWNCHTCSPGSGGRPASCTPDDNDYNDWLRHACKVTCNSCGEDFGKYTGDGTHDRRLNVANPGAHEVSTDADSISRRRLSALTSVAMELTPGEILSSGREGVIAIYLSINDTRAHLEGFVAEHYECLTSELKAPTGFFANLPFDMGFLIGALMLCSVVVWFILRLALFNVISRNSRVCLCFAERGPKQAKFSLRLAKMSKKLLSTLCPYALNMVMVLNSTLMYLPNDSSYFASLDAVGFVFLMTTLFVFAMALGIMIVFIGLALPPALIALCMSTVTKKGPSATSIVGGAVYSVIVFSLFAFSILGAFALFFTLLEGFVNQAVDWSDLFIKFLLIPPDLSASFEGTFPAFTITMTFLRLGKVVFITGPLVVDLISTLQGLVLFMFCIDLDSKYGSPYDEGETLEAYQELETQRDVTSKLSDLIKVMKQAQGGASKEELDENKAKLKEALDTLNELRKKYKKVRERSDLQRMTVSKKEKKMATTHQQATHTISV